MHVEQVYELMEATKSEKQALDTLKEHYKRKKEAAVKVMAEYPQITVKLFPSLRSLVRRASSPNHTRTLAGFVSACASSALRSVTQVRISMHRHDHVL